MAHVLKHYNPPQDPFLDILYQDTDIIAVNKPSGLLSVPGKLPEHQDCVETRARTLFPESAMIHRLDMETSGVILLAQTLHALRHVSMQFEKRKTKKKYIAQVFGLLKDDEGTIDQPLICDWPNRPLQMIDHERGKKAITHYKVLSKHATYTRVALTPITGRSHQLRVHMQYLGHPILGDPLYAKDAALAAASRLHLHAETLTITHPSTGETLTFTVPADF